MSNDLKRTQDGYLWIEAPDGRPVYVHRLVAVAHGKLDGLGDSRHVHHMDGLTVVNSPENLQALEADDHCRRHIAAPTTP